MFPQDIHKLSIDQLRLMLARQNGDYLLLQPPTDSDDKYFLFIGPFDQREVIWHAHLMTLQSFNRQNKQMLEKQMMAITPINEAHFKIDIVLKVDALTEANITMAMMMVRQYKRLKTGHHYWN